MKLLKVEDIVVRLLANLILLEEELLVLVLVVSVIVEILEGCVQFLEDQVESLLPCHVGLSFR